MDQTTLVLRLAGLTQSWSGFRATRKVSPTSLVPTKSGVGGMLAACLGLTDREDVGALVGDFSLNVRIDRPGHVNLDTVTFKNPSPSVCEDMEWASPGAKARILTSNGDNWALANAKYEREFLAGAEFIAAVVCADGLASRLQEALTEPRFAPYLGKRAHSLSFPFFLGSTDRDPLEVLASLPARSPAGNGVAPPIASDSMDDLMSPAATSTQQADIYNVEGNYLKSDPMYLSKVSVPSTSLREQLAWANRNLNR